MLGTELLSSEEPLKKALTAKPFLPRFVIKPFIAAQTGKFPIIPFLYTVKMCFCLMGLLIGLMKR